MLPLEEGGVADSKLKMYGVMGLKIVEASVVPLLISGYIQTTVYAIAES